MYVFKKIRTKLVNIKKIVSAILNNELLFTVAEITSELIEQNIIPQKQLLVGKTGLY